MVMATRFPRSGRRCTSRPAWLILLLAGPAALLTGSCTTAKHPAMPLVRMHAAKDLRCPDKKIHVTPLLGNRYKATGCGRTAVYFGACEQLQCSVGDEDTAPPPWRGRPDPDSADALR